MQFSAPTHRPFTPSPDQAARLIARRHFLQGCGVGVGKLALAGLLAGRASTGNTAGAATSAANDPLVTRPPHSAPKAKNVIHLFMAGGPSQLDLFDPKPALSEFQGKPLPPSIIGDQRYAFIRPDAAVLGPQFSFAQHGQSGAQIADVLPHLASIADDIAIVRSVTTDQFNHAPAQIFMNTGFLQPGRPCLGSWALYGLGAESSNLPAFVVMSTGSGISGGAANWSSGFLPSVYAGVRFRNAGDPILHVSSPAGIDPQLQRDTLDLTSALNHRLLDSQRDPEIASRIASYEMAFRLQSSAPELTDLSTESPEILAMYGAEPDKASFARSCLYARRMIERGVRFVNIYHEGWDAHSDVAGNSRKNAAETDQASAALVRDLKQRGLLDDTLVIWGGEFGRTPMVENNPVLNRSAGRDHHPQAFTMWMAGGGIRPGITWGATDDFGFHITQDPIHIHDLHATILHLLGFDHERLTHRFQGRDFRLTDVHGKIAHGILA